MQRSHLPDRLGGSFSVAAARAAGIPASRLRARDLDRPFHGVRSRTGARTAAVGAEEDLIRRAIAYATRMTEHQVFSHVTAAVLWGAPLPRGVVEACDVDVAVFAPHRAPTGAGVHGHTLRPGLASVMMHPVLEVPLVSPASAWAQLGAVLRDVRDLVAAGDAMVRAPLRKSHPPALAAVAHLQAAVDAGRRPGVGRLRAALPRLCVRSRSRPESWLRLILDDAGLPAAEANFDVVETGVWLAQVDLAYPRARVALEYEGEHHLTDPAQWARDIDRVERLAAHGWQVIRVTKGDVFVHPERLVRRVRDALARASR